MSTQKTSILILRTINSKDTNFEKTIKTLEENTNFHSVLCEDLSSAKTMLADDKFNIVVVHCNTLQDEPELWRKVLYESKARNKFSEIIVIISDKDPDKNIEASEVLTSGCFAFFQHNYNEEVLLGYIAAADKKSIERKNREQFSQELSKHILLDDVVTKVVEQFNAMTTYDNITISLLKDDPNNQGYLRKLIYTNIPEEEIKWDLLGPTSQDELIQKILSGDITRRVFPDVKTDLDIRDLFNKDNKTPNINSWIALPLKHAGKSIGLITLDSETPEHFKYEKINEVALERIANQAATAIQYAERDNAHTKLISALNALDQSNNLEETLRKLSIETRELVDGLFSYIVTPDSTNSYLKFDAAWSRDHGDYIGQLSNKVSFEDKKTNKRIAGFEIVTDKPDKGITVVAFEKRKYKLLQNIQHKVNYIEPDLESFQAYHEFIYKDKNGKKVFSNTNIAIPILGNDDQVLGVINVEHEHPFAFTKEQITALEILASFASIAITRDLKERFTKDLYQFSDFQFNEESSFDDIRKFLETIASKVKMISNAEYVSVFSVKDNVSFIVGTANKPPEMITEGARPFTRDTMGHTGWAVKNKLSVIIPDTKVYKNTLSTFKDINYNQYKRDDENHTVIDINDKTNIDFIKALMCFPMILPGGQVNGVIWLHYVNNPNYTKEQIKLFEILASRAAYALHIAETLKFNNIEVKIGNATDKIGILNEIIDSAKDYFGLGGASIYEANPEDQTLTRVVSNINNFPPNEIIKYGEGLAGRLILGKDDKNHQYSQRWFTVQNYSSDYAHAILTYSQEQFNELKSVFGILIPFDKKTGKDIGVLIVTSKEAQRTYKESLPDFIRLANIAGRHLNNPQNISNKTEIVKDKPSKFYKKRITNLERILNIVTWVAAFVMPIFTLLLLDKYQIKFQEDGYKLVLAFLLSYIICMLNPKLRENKLTTAVYNIIINAISSFLFN